MKSNPKDHSSDSLFNVLKPLPKLTLSLVLFLSLFVTLYSLKSIYLPSHTAPHTFSATSCTFSRPEPGPEPGPNPETNLSHIVFGIAAAARHWGRRKDYTKTWWQPGLTRGFVFLDKPVNLTKLEYPSSYPEIRISQNTSNFKYSNRRGSRSAIRITRIISEMARMDLEDVRWFVMGDDDTVFIPENLVRVLKKYDHTKMYYIGSNSETHMQNIHFSYGMAYGGGGFAISYPLAKAIEQMQDRCIERYTSLYGSDDRIQACLSELGVPLTKEPGFHQFDIYGNLFGILAAHPITPLVTLHHLDIVEPLFPLTSRHQALQRLMVPSKLDSASLMQQSICYDPDRNWTVSVSWGYAVQIIRGSVSPREMEQPARTFLNWYKRDEPAGFSFNTRPLSKHPCQKPYIYYFSDADVDSMTNLTSTAYKMYSIPHPWCWWKMDSPEKIHRVEVYKKPNPLKWEEAPRRDCCRVLSTEKEHTVVIDVGECREGEIIEP